ncbi:hypothetical protein [Amycolatopsis coloradensis]|uniref:hypothetical protein n=1 Tax=Amycolatopsis coloradensis TaxID=76021 RepID=UPI001177DF93|nr:hypothetical protein [Amycolatopsis coloradensis]
MSSEPRFLDSGRMYMIGTLVRDFGNFVLGLVFYALCWSVGAVAFLIDKLFRTELFERFVRLAEIVDDRGR